MGILVDMSGDTMKFQVKGWTDRQVVNVLDWDINDVFNDRFINKRLTRHRHMTRLTWLADYYNTNLKGNC